MYDPRTRFGGVERFLVWWVPEEGTAYALNSPGKMITPSLKWPRDDGLDPSVTGHIVDYVFKKKPMPPAKPAPELRTTECFTVKEYRIYRAIMNTPMSIRESEAFEIAGKRYGVTAAQAEKMTKKVLRILSLNDWFGSPESEIKHASGWGEEMP